MNPRYPNVGTIGHVDQDPIRRAWFDAAMQQLADAPVQFKPTHWPPRLTRMALAVRMGTTRMLLERRP